MWDDPTVAFIGGVLAAVLSCAVLLVVFGPSLDDAARDTPCRVHFGPDAEWAGERCVVRRVVVEEVSDGE